ncbi:MAG: hypothetical protein IBX56_11490 [Methylomicrobium sp.]|nr:hypothetical protein [Methylomicrobium sp.]
MSGTQIDWLPDLVLMEDSRGDWGAYLARVYQFFQQDFVDKKPSFQGKRLSLKRHPVIDGKEATFWHMISEGDIEEERTPDIRRMERIRWPRPIIENAREIQATLAIKVWRNIRRKNESRILLWLEAEQYLVVLADRGDYILPWTAYQVTRSHQQRKLQKEYEKYWQLKEK